MKRYALAPAAIALGLSFGSAPAWATGLPVAPAGEQGIEQSIGAVQLQNTNVSPAVAVNAPVNVNAPVSVLSYGGGGDAVQKNEVEAETETAQGGVSAEQEIEQSLGAVQAHVTNVSPTVAANAPVNANAPVSVLSKGGGGKAVQKNAVEAETETKQGGGCGCGPTSSSTSKSSPGKQEIEQSLGAAQLRKTNVSPAAAGGAPLNANAPVSVLSKGGGGNAVQPNEVEAETTKEGGGCGCSGSGEQEIEKSLGAVQAQNTNVSPAVAASAPVNANAPFGVLSGRAGGDAVQKNDVEAATTYTASASGMLPFTGISLVWAVLLWLALTCGATALAAVRNRLT